MLSAISQPQGTNIHKASNVAKLKEAERRRVAPGGWRGGGGNWGAAVPRTQSFGQAGWRSSGDLLGGTVRTADSAPLHKQTLVRRADTMVTCCLPQ